MINLVTTILSGTDQLIEGIKSAIETCMEGDAPLTDNDEKMLRKFQEELITLVKFRKKFAIGDSDYDKDVLHRVVEYISEMQE